MVSRPFTFRTEKHQVVDKTWCPVRDSNPCYSLERASRIGNFNDLLDILRNFVRLHQQRGATLAHGVDGPLRIYLCSLRVPHPGSLSRSPPHRLPP